MIYCLIDDSRLCLKVGFSKDESTLKKRIKQLQTASPFKISTYATKEGDLIQEAEIHDLLKQHKTSGGSEWFILNAQTKLLIDNVFNLSESTVIDSEQYSELFECTFTELEGILGCEDCEIISHWTTFRTHDGTGMKNATYINDAFGEVFRMISVESLYESVLSHANAYLQTQEEIENEIPFFKLISMQLFQQQISEEGEFLNSRVFQGINNESHVLLCLEASLVETQLAEEILETYFWILDAVGVQLSVGIITKDRQLHLVPYLFVFN